MMSNTHGGRLNSELQSFSQPSQLGLGELELWSDHPIEIIKF